MHQAKTTLSQDEIYDTTNHTSRFLGFLVDSVLVTSLREGPQHCTDVPEPEETTTSHKASEGSNYWGKW